MFIRKALNLSIALLLCFSTPAYATPQFTFLSEGQPSPFEGALFNPEALAEVLAKSQLIEEEYKLKLGYELEKQELNFQLEIDTLGIHISSLEQEYDVIVEAKDAEIEDLHNLIKNHSPATNVWWAAGGFALGIATATFVVYVSE